MILSERISNLEKRQMALTKEIPQIQEEISLLRIKEQSGVMINQVRTISETFPKLTFQEQRMIMEELLESIRINKDTVDIDLYFLPVFQKNLGLLKNSTESMSVRLFYGPAS